MIRKLAYAALATGLFFGAAQAQEGMIDALNAALRQGINTPERQRIFDTQGAEPIASSPKDFDRFLKTESERMTTMLRDAGIVAQ